MQTLDVKRFLDAYHLLVSVSAAIHNREDTHQLAFDPNSSPLVIEQATALIPVLQQLDLNMSAITAQHVLDHMKKGSLLLEVKGQIESLHGRINDEFKVRTVLILPRDKEELFSQNVPIFGAEVSYAFPSASNDIAEAGKCLP
jgi:hypothetical protein